MFGLLGILLALCLLIVLAYRGHNVIVLAPLCALVAVVIGGAPILASYTQVFMPALGGFIISFFPLFLTGAIFGKLMTDTGYARGIAMAIVGRLGPSRAVLATVLTGTVLTYGGISVFVVAFGLFPIARELFRAADIPRRLIPAAIALGAFTYVMSALPGSPQVQNAIPGPYFGTDTYSAPLLGIAGAVVIFSFGMAWLTTRVRAAERRGEGYDGPRAVAEGSGTGAGGSRARGTGGGGVGQLVLEEVGIERPVRAAVPSLMPVLIVVVLNLALTQWIFPALDFGHLETDAYGNTTISQVSGLWSVMVALTAAIGYILVVNHREIRRLVEGLHEGARSSVLPIFSTGSEVGFGAVIASLPAFGILRDGLIGLSANPLVGSSVATTSLAGVTASASGGLTIALDAFGADLQAMAVEQGISLELMHRLTAVAAGGLDTLPHSGAIITLLVICGTTHRKSYMDIAMVTIVGPLIAAGLLLTFGLVSGGIAL